ncbi:rIIB-like lysis inhibitor [Agrobacterium phage OLIVR2]|uniref:RIIB-like lysis inhibitor n=1 Tax=Agrobacterium phage OLIVR1 TaxID=2723769 RepID=A0A858MRN5_9CAUD|nr:hypothetical protein [Xanthomonas campestris]YP_010107098.1 RIIB lysis inhibitor [Agrobacterium phage OLIVR1]QIW87367.1 rIIB-like lysis inhibitor [Agrobacterium phage OLIVR2]QIW87474.1 rIIB-like lysis inhibitor [Agrobacterium phage OLIVR3]MCF8861646.1 hypothetical protein [Xanthomonas campestris pv. campestris]QIW87259.1 rIIB-like lysis inhibitor [Agrobacterium phage OLIVR1]
MSNKDIITVVGAVADKDKVVFYTDTGDKRIVPQSDPRLAVLLQKVIPEIQRGRSVTVSLEDYSLYEEFEKKTNSLVRFFRAAKEKVKTIVEAFIPAAPEKDDSDVEEDTKAYHAKVTAEAEIAVDAVATETLLEEAEKVAPVVPQKPRYEDLKQDLKPIKNDEPIADDETLVAVINGVAIPGVENLKSYIQHALKHNSPKAVTAFLERIARVIDQRGHSIPDLMRFLERGDLPLAEDGSIIAYKILRKTDRHPGFTYVDCHSGKVHQRVGTYVRVDESLVDKNRRNECSNGLHVARRGYIGHFSGDVCTIIKMAPEDVIAVPHNDPNKVRVCGYHIIFELPNHVYNVLRSNRPMTSDTEAAAMLAKAISGDHVGVLEEVWIGGSYGSNLSIKNRVDGYKATSEIQKTKVDKTEKVSKKAAAFDDATKNGIDPRQLNQKIKEENSKIAEEKKATGSLSISDRAREMFNRQLYADVKALSKTKKKSLRALGFNENEIDTINVGHATETLVVKQETPKAEPKKKVEKPASSKATKPVNVKNDPPAEPAKPGLLDGKDLTEQEVLYLKNKWEELYALKKKKKKSWVALGFSTKEIEDIEKNKP